MEYIVNGHTIRYQVQGDTHAGEDQCLLNHHRDLTERTAWSEKGYTVAPLFERNELFSVFRKEMIALLFRCWRTAGLTLSENFDPEWYHTVIPDQQIHLRAVQQTKLLTIDRLPVDIAAIEERISLLCGRSLVAENPFNHERVFHFRVIRPCSADNNPLHKDVWLEEYSDCINLYIPVAGSNSLSSLILVPGSHRWNESRVERTTAGARINHQRFNVPAVARINGPHELVRPDPKPNEVLIFSPYLIHGGAVNLNEHLTRISVELRLWEK